LPPITITTGGEGGLIGSDLEAIVYQWQQNLGVGVKVRQLETQRFLYNLKEEKNEMYLSGWIADYPHPQDFLDVLFHTGADNNYGEYSNPEVDAILEAAAEQNSEQSLVLYQQAEQKLVSDASCLPIYFGRNYTLVKPYVKGYNPSPLGFVRLSEVSVEPH
jgi:oligopeptide transport system substrate-binding protein